MSDQPNFTASYDRTPPNYNAGETMRITVSGTNTHTTDPTTATDPIGAFNISVVSDPSGARTTIAAPAGGTVTRVVPGVVTTEQGLIDAAAGAVLTLGNRQWTVSTDRKSLTSVA